MIEVFLIIVYGPQGKDRRKRNCQSRKELSLLDNVFVSTSLYEQVKSMLIDEQQMFTPWRKLK